MCGGVSYKENEKQVKVYFPVPNASLPVLNKDKSLNKMTWGRRREEKGALPLGGWARHESILKGVWEKYQPIPVKIAVDAFMEKDNQKTSHWFDLAEGEYIQGLVANSGDEQRVYVVTVEPDDKSIHDRWPRIVEE
ncbi:MAG: hypothetical protein P8Y20_04830 [Gammaproteobacteria bacterium]|jgi:hypothetical protein